MARKEIDWVVEAEGRDQGKRFHLVEMSASRAERWAMRALQATARAGINVDSAALTGGMQGVAAAGIQALLTAPFHEVEGLLDEMMECVTFKPDAKHLNLTRPLVEDDIEEVATRLMLRKEILQLHVGFSLAGASSTSEFPMTSATALSPNASTSREPSRSSSHPAKRN